MRTHHLIEGAFAVLGTEVTARIWRMGRCIENSSMFNDCRLFDRIFSGV